MNFTSDHNRKLQTSSCDKRMVEAHPFHAVREFLNKSAASAASPDHSKFQAVMKSAASAASLRGGRGSGRLDHGLLFVIFGRASAQKFVKISDSVSGGPHRAQTFSDQLQRLKDQGSKLDLNDSASCIYLHSFHNVCVPFRGSGARLHSRGLENERPEAQDWRYMCPLCSPPQRGFFPVISQNTSSDSD